MRRSATDHHWGAVAVWVTRTKRARVAGTSMAVSWPEPLPDAAVVQCYPSSLVASS